MYLIAVVVPPVYLSCTVFLLFNSNVNKLVFPCQILDNVAWVIMEESEEGNSTYDTWHKIFIGFDLVCCFTILFPVIWWVKKQFLLEARSFLFLDYAHIPYIFCNSLWIMKAIVFLWFNCPDPLCSQSNKKSTLIMPSCATILLKKCTFLYTLFRYIFSLLWTEMKKFDL